MTNNAKTIFITSLIAIAIVIIGVAMINANQASEQKQKAVITADDLIGEPLPDIQLKDKDGNTYDLANLRGKSVVLFFNEGLMCYPACWNQIASFGADARFNSEDRLALSVVVDSSQNWRKAIEKMPDLAKATTLFDAEAVSSKQLGILSLGSSMHVGQLPGHTYILLDKQGIVREVFDDPNMGVNNDILVEKMSKF